MSPQAYQRRVLVCVTGLSAQVVTEALYALAVSAPEEDRFVPTEICVLTTLEGAKRIELNLLSENPGWFHRLISDWQLPPVPFSMENVYVFLNPQGQPVEDIRTLQEHEAAADMITDKVRELTLDDNCALHVSIAGGRKTQGFLLGYALSLFGRSQDRLSHVLVSTPFEYNNEFYYPTPQSHVIYTAPPENRPLNTRDAIVTLAMIPFVPLRAGLPDRLLSGRVAYSEAIASIRPLDKPIVLKLNVLDKTVMVAGKMVKFSPTEFAFYLWFAERRKADLPSVRSVDFLDLRWEFFGIYSKVQRQQGTRTRVKESLEGLDGDVSTARDYFYEKVNRTNRLVSMLGHSVAGVCEIRKSGQRSQQRYGLLGLVPEQILIET